MSSVRRHDDAMNRVLEAHVRAASRSVARCTVVLSCQPIARIAANAPLAVRLRRLTSDPEDRDL
jgi:hypothetical protein